MVYSPEDVKRMLDAVKSRVLQRNPDFAHAEYLDLCAVVEQIEKEIELSRWAYGSGPGTLAGDKDL